MTTLMCQIKVHKLKKKPKFIGNGNLDIHFFFILILFIIWTWQIHEWEDISKPSNIYNIIDLFTVLHIVEMPVFKTVKNKHLGMSPF